MGSSAWRVPSASSPTNPDGRECCSASSNQRTQPIVPHGMPEVRHSSSTRPYPDAASLGAAYRAAGAAERRRRPRPANQRQFGELMRLPRFVARILSPRRASLVAGAVLDADMQSIDPEKTSQKAFSGAPRRRLERAGADGVAADSAQPQAPPGRAPRLQLHDGCRRRTVRLAQQSPGRVAQ